MGTTATARRTGALLAALVGLLASLLIGVAAPAPATAAAPRTLEVVGQITGPQAKLPKIRVRWFTQDWTYLGEKAVRNDIYTLSLAPGTYHLQFVDQRPAYDVTKYAPADVTVTLRDRKVQRNVRMKRGSAITGTVRAGGKVAGGAKVVAANTFEQSYETKANQAGQFAIGGLPAGKYSVFTYDRTATWVDKSLYAGKIKGGQAVNVAIKLRKKGGSLLVDLFRGDGTRASGKFAVTAVSKKTGQFWTATARSGRVTFRGLYPGGYTLVAPGTGDWLARTGTIEGANVRAGKADLASRFLWTKRGASVTGRLIFRSNGDIPVGEAEVQLFNRAGAVIGRTTSSSSGAFRFGGQLTTQSGMTVVVTAGARKVAPYCKFGRAQVTSVAVTTGRESGLGDIVLPHVAGETDPACA